MMIHTGRHIILKRIKNSRLLLHVLIVLLCSSCFKNLPDKHVIYENDFETNDTTHIQLYDITGPIDTLKIVEYNGSKVLGRFNTNFVIFNFDYIPVHNTIKIELDLLIHDQWDGEYIPPGFTNPDLWQLAIDNYPLYVTTFSNGQHSQAFPDNHIFGSSSKNPARSDAWEVLPGVCGYAGKADGTTVYKLEYTTAHTNSHMIIGMNDVLNPILSQCLKSWSIDNIRITAIDYR